MLLKYVYVYVSMHSYIYIYTYIHTYTQVLRLPTCAAQALLIGLASIKWEEESVLATSPRRCTHVHVCMHVCLCKGQEGAHMLMYVCLYVCAITHMLMHVCTYVCAITQKVHTCSCMYAHMHAHVCMLICMLMYVCSCMRTYKMTCCAYT